MNDLRAVQGRQILEITNIDERIKKQLGESTGVSMKDRDLKDTSRKLHVMSDNLLKLVKSRAEYNARREFLDRLISIVDTKWSGQALRDFLSGQLLDMALTEFTAPSTDGKEGLFLVYLSIAVRELAEPKENLIGFVEDYMNFASILDAKTPTEFLGNRSYTNGVLSYTAKSVDRAKLGEMVEKQLSELGVESPSHGRRHSPSNIELRIKDPSSIPGTQDAPKVSPDSAPAHAEARVRNG